MLFCENLANTMKLDEIAQDAGLDVNGEALLARAKQLVKLEVSCCRPIKFLFSLFARTNSPRGTQSYEGVSIHFRAKR
jgi:hypothetical protein